MWRSGRRGRMRARLPRSEMRPLERWKRRSARGFAERRCDCVGPGVVEVPDEVVEERELDGEGGGEEVVRGEWRG